MRGLSLARAAAERGIATRVLSNSPFLPSLRGDHVQRLIALDPRVEILSFAATLSRESLVAAILPELRSCRANDVLVVDAFPRGIAGELATELASIPSLKVFVHRDLNPEYVRQANLDRVLVEYQLILLAGEAGPLAKSAHVRTAPWMICESGELMTRLVARKTLGITEDQDAPLIVVSGSGTASEAVASSRLACRLDQALEGKYLVRFCSLDAQGLRQAGELGCAVWPLMVALPGVDLLIGAGGYHTVYEARNTGTRLIGFPQQRVYDRQAKRLRASERVTNFEEMITECLLPGCESQSVGSSDVTDPNRPADVQYVNGAQQACELILRCCQQ